MGASLPRSKFESIERICSRNCQLSGPADPAQDNRKFMLSAREAYKTAVSGMSQSFNKGGRSSGPLNRPNETANTTTEDPNTPIASVNPGFPNESLMRALLSSQKQTIAHYQLDRDSDRSKIEMLTAKLAKAEELARSRGDYSKLQKQSEAGYEAGVKFGEKKVSSVS